MKLGLGVLRGQLDQLGCGKTRVVAVADSLSLRMVLSMGPTTVDSGTVRCIEAPLLASLDSLHALFVSVFSPGYCAGEHNGKVGNLRGAGANSTDDGVGRRSHTPRPHLHSRLEM